MNELNVLSNIEDPVKKRSLFIALFSKEMLKLGGSMPIIVGGEALELYTQGSYTTGDIDIKASLDLTKIILESWDFNKKGRTWFNKEFDLYVDWLGASLEEGDEAEKRAVTVKIIEGLEIKILSVEDLIIDRLNAAKWWGDKDSIMWAKVLVAIQKKISGNVDINYLQKRAKYENLLDYLNEVLS